MFLFRRSAILVMVSVHGWALAEPPSKKELVDLWSLQRDSIATAELKLCIRNSPVSVRANPDEFIRAVEELDPSDDALVNSFLQRFSSEAIYVLEDDDESVGFIASDDDRESAAQLSSVVSAAFRGDDYRIDLPIGDGTLSTAI